MAVCTYDNPATMQRECWQNGRLLCAYSHSILQDVAREPIPGRLLFFGANVGDWKAGQCLGDPAARTRGETSTDPSMGQGVGRQAQERERP